MNMVSLFKPALIFLSSVLQCLEYKSCSYFIKFMPNYFIFLDAIVNYITFVFNFNF